MGRLFPSAEGIGPNRKAATVRRSAQRLSALCPLGMGDISPTAAGRMLPRNDGAWPSMMSAGATARSAPIVELRHFEILPAGHVGHFRERLAERLRGVDANRRRG